MAYMDLYPSYGPGGSNFRDVTSIFAEASEAMEPGSIIAIDGFSLTDAMSAIEIGEPRLDTGMQLDGATQQASFDPLTPLLPEEICWIIDRSMAYEMEWHTSNPLAHTVFTMLHVHALGDIDPDILPHLYMIDLELQRPLQLITVVLRAYISGLLHSCSLVWTELFKGSLMDTEDWQSDKSGISLLEGWPVQAAIARLDDAINWLSRTTQVPPLWQAALKSRLQFRRTILLLLNILSGSNSLARERAQFLHLLKQARELLLTIRAHVQSQALAPTLPSSSPARAAFDPYIARKLDTFLPVRIIEVPSPEQTYDAYESLLDGWEELARLSNTYHITTWDQVGCHQMWFTAPAARAAYIRSCAQNLFYDGVQVLHSRPQGWVVERIFEETLGVPYRTIAKHWGGPGSANLVEMERTIVHTLIPHVRSQWYNPPRRRRFLVKSLLDWHMVYDHLCTLVESLDVSDMDLSPADLDVLGNLPKVAVLWRLASIREVILSGFQLELYHPLERPFAYWFAAEVVEVHLTYLEAVIGREGVSEDREAGAGAGAGGMRKDVRREQGYQHGFLSALKAMCLGMFVLLIHTMPPNTLFSQWEQLGANLRRRYKWAFNRAAYERFEFEPEVLAPDFVKFLRAVGEVQDLKRSQDIGQAHRQGVLNQEEEGNDGPNQTQKTKKDSSSAWMPFSEYFTLAEGSLQDLLSTRNTGVLVDDGWASDRIKLMQGMLETCQELRGLPLTKSPSGEGDTSRKSRSESDTRLDWTWSYGRDTPIEQRKKTPWFPSVSRRDVNASVATATSDNTR
ncbi:hypothetical protein GYMLUDRAFT_71269 [Collybiopsis luxurians FD-317 M1]|nr:hypothetical protein GYMLUDRAFT_71269 [Collybiopsis luxurians FD-317 M1]